MKELILNEEELARRCSNNDRHAQEFLFNHHYQDLYLISMRYLSDHHNAEDVIIQSFTRVFKNIKRFNYQGQPSLSGSFANPVSHCAALRAWRTAISAKSNEIISISHQSFPNSF